MKTRHRIYFSDAADMDGVSPDSVHLVVTSPPYPMIEMWDALFRRHKRIDKAFKRQDGPAAFELMHAELDRVWAEVHRVLAPGGIACINIGDATRTLRDEFALYANHSRILSSMLALGFINLPNILWRKQTNAPNKFMGSGMMPPGAYVTLEHEYILIFRKGGKRQFNGETQKANRRQSAFFWEERNQWFSDVWMDLKGARQKTVDRHLRARSGAFPFELAYRLVSMFSVMHDTVLDPFLGTGTTFMAAAVAGRNSIGFELEKTFAAPIAEDAGQIVTIGRQRIAERIDAHQRFIADRLTAGKPIKYANRTYGFPVITRQETDLMLPLPATVETSDGSGCTVDYEKPDVSAGGVPPKSPAAEQRCRPSGQMLLFD